MTGRVPAAVAERLAALGQYLLPQHPLSRLAHRATRVRWRPWKDALIRWFVRRYDVDMSLAAEPDPTRYACFNDLFTRALRDGVRPLDPDPEAVLAPVDGTVSIAGEVRGTSLVQAKGHQYTLAELLAGDEAMATMFNDGACCTLYLSPRDYHRVHMPLAGVLQETRAVPGALFAVNATSRRRIPRLYARNERLVCLFETAAGAMAVILVGALLVGCIETVWGESHAPLRRGRPLVRRYRDGVALARGAELGRFNMGSTVIVLFQRGRVRWAPELTAGAGVRVGTAIGRVLAEASASRHASARGRPMW